MYTTPQYLANILRSDEFVRPNQFQVDITPPTSITVSSDTLKSISMNCKSANIPGWNVETSYHSHGGHYAHDFVKNRTNTALQTSFYLSENMKERDLFIEWQKIMFDQKHQNLNYYDEYASGTVDITIIGRKQNKYTKKFKYIDCYPKNVNEIPLSFDDRDAVSILDIDWSYYQWEEVEE